MARRQPPPWRSAPQAPQESPPTLQQVQAIFEGWRNNLEVAIQEAIIDPYNVATKQNVKMTTQQREATRAATELICAKIAVHAGKATEAQTLLAKKIGISIMAGKGIGKDAWVSWMILTFAVLFPYCKIPCTSVSADQLDKVLWSELAKWLQHSLFAPWLKLQSGKLFFTDLPDDVRGKRWFAYTKTANPNATELEPEGMAGAHEDYMMIVVDEASGVSDAIMGSLEGTCTQFGNFMILIFNPTRGKGYAIRSQEEDAQHWIALHWNAEESEIRNQAVIERLLERYGRDSNPYRIRVLGLPPITDTNTLIPWEWLEEAVARESMGNEGLPLIKGVDCGAGGDKSVIATRRGWQVYPMKRLVTPDSTALTHWIGTDIDAEHPDVVYIDTIGIGWAVEGQLRNLKGYVIQAADARRAADRPDQYLNKRAEMYDRLREALERGLLALPNDPDLLDQLGAIRCDKYAGSKMKIVEKARLVKEIGHSPDEADALAMTFYRADHCVTRLTHTPPRLKIVTEFDLDRPYQPREMPQERGRYGVTV